MRYSNLHPPYSHNPLPHHQVPQKASFGSCRAGTDLHQLILDQSLQAQQVDPEGVLPWRWHFFVPHQSLETLLSQAYLQNKQMLPLRLQSHTEPAPESLLKALQSPARILWMRYHFQGISK